jgi:hypothetical protein
VSVAIRFRFKFGLGGVRVRIWSRLWLLGCVSISIATLTVAAAQEATPPDDITAAGIDVQANPSDVNTTPTPYTTPTPIATYAATPFALPSPSSTPAQSLIGSALDVLARTPTGGPLLARARANQVIIYSAAWLPGAFAEFDQRRKQVILSSSIWSPDPRAIAALIAHELRHVSDFLDRRPERNQAECEDWELRAHRTELQVWCELDGWNIASDGSPYRQRLALLRDAGDRLPEVIHDMYLTSCSWYSRS